ncbi:MAG: YggT family protein [Simkaniaceae bacterium]|jgi:YggT family protein
MIYLVYIIRLVFTVYSLLIVIRIFGSWFPNLQHSRFMHFIAHYTDPYLNIFRRFIPPIGGVLDLSPLIGFFVLQLAQKLLLMLIL